MDIPAWFYDFIALKADRAYVLKEELQRRLLQYKAVTLNGDTHFLVYPCNAKRKENYRLKLITAHYDRVSGTQGVLDNSCAVWQLLDFASIRTPKENVLIALTDHEEIPHQGSVKEQGAFFLGKALASMGIDAPAVFCFDVTGHGDTVLIADTVQQVVQHYTALQPLQHEVSLLSRLLMNHLASHIRCMEGYLPFGENLGFMLAGLPALEITIVPFAEAPRRLNEFGDSTQAVLEAAPIPKIWSYLHSTQDTVDLLMPEAFFIMQKVLAALAAMRIAKHGKPGSLA